MVLDPKAISKWSTKLKPVIDESCEAVELVTLSMKHTWIVTDFGRNLQGQFIYIIQPLENPSGMGEGVTGMWVFCLTEEELVKYFELKDGE